MCKNVYNNNNKNNELTNRLTRTERNKHNIYMISGEID